MEEYLEEEVRRVLMSPEEAEDSVKGRKNVRAVVGNRLLQVTVKEERARVIIVTVIDKTR